MTDRPGASATGGPTTEHKDQPVGPVRIRSANCIAGDHDECLMMVEQDVAELGITDCLCGCHANTAIEAEARTAHHFDGDSCGDPDHPAIMEAWYRRAEGLLDRGLDVERLARAFVMAGVKWPKKWGDDEFRWVARQVAAAYSWEHDRLVEAWESSFETEARSIGRADSLDVERLLRAYAIFKRDSDHTDAVKVDRAYDGLFRELDRLAAAYRSGPATREPAGEDRTRE
jgi:hypothetical protein